MMDRGDRLMLPLWLWTLLLEHERSSMKSKVKCPAREGVGGVGGGTAAAVAVVASAVMLNFVL
jgi:hypothetical protein